MARMVEIATKKGGSLSPGQKWRGNKAKLKFLDAEGRPFEALPGNIRRGGWSPWEAGLSRDPAWHMALLRDIASRRGGKVEEGQTYANNTTKLWFIDAAGQRFGASPANVKGGQWSPYEGYTSEHICRQAVEHLFGGQSFPQSWDIVSRPNGNRLQLDGYNEAERCAFEYQGIYHEIIDEQKIRDREKVAFCAIAGIALAVVPEFKKKDKLDSQAIMDHVRKHVEDALRSSGRSEHVALLRTEGFEVNHATIGRNIIGMRELLKWMGEHWPGAAIAPGEFFKGLSEKLKVAGPDGMERFLSPGAIRSRQWEKDDLRREKTRDMVLGHAASLAKSTARKIKKANEAASMMKEEVFDTLSADDRSRIERMVSSSSEPVNAKQPPPLGDQAVFSLICMAKLAFIAQKRGGHLEEGQAYCGTRGRLWFVDGQGHRFAGNVGAIFDGGWSPYESGNTRDLNWHHDRMARAAREKGGSIAAGSTYQGSLTKMKFIDAAGREFESLPKNVLKGNWSPYESNQISDPLWHLEEMKRMAREHGGDVAPGESYLGSRLKMRFIDKEGNEFRKRPSEIRQGYWSPFEPSKKLRRRNTPT